GKVAPSGSGQPPSTRSALEAFDRDAAAGERLDPDNAFFPFMRSVGLFAEHRDDEALAAIQRAGAKPRFRDYATDQVEGEWELMRASSGNRSAMQRAAMAAALLFPHYAQLRAAARVATYRAIESERQGRPNEGIAVRV